MSSGEDVRAVMAEMKGASEGQAAPEAVPVPASTPGTGNRFPEPSGTTGTSARPRDEAGRFAKGGDKPPEEATPVPPNEATPAEAAKSEAEKPKTKRPPPQAFRPTVKEKWDSVDPEVQEEFLRIEQATKHALSQRAEEAKTASRWQEVLKPYAQHIQGDPVQYVDNLMQTATALVTGSEAQRAGILAQLARAYNVGVEAMAGAWDGPQGGSPQPQQQAPQRQVAPDPHEYANQVYSIMQQRMIVDQFTKEAEFLEEPMPDGAGTIRDAVADLLDVAGKRGIAMTPQQAYSRVVAMHPTVTEALKQREAKANAERSQAQTAQAKAASSSLRTEPVVVSPEPDGGGTVHDDVRASVALLRRAR